MKTTKEPYIIINGMVLGVAEAMTVRVAIQGFGVDLQEDGLGDNEHGKAMTKAYLQCIHRINSYMSTSPKKDDC